MQLTESPTLAGSLVTLEPLSFDHVAELREAANEAELWRAWYTSIPHPEAMTTEVERRLSLHEQGKMLPWATRLASTGRIVGMTTFMNPSTDAQRLEIGSTWLARSAQGTGANREAKLLQLTYAFDVLDCIAVEFRTHWHNRQSRKAIAALGAKEDGVLRSHSVGPDGALRDTVIFSITASEWPAVRLGLRHSLTTREFSLQ
ncbi:Protein N-acetyltransferase, RimJ/RimL family [Cryobacterium flavum]|uniref:N-acetyltransferase n=1 Tax=Cryobacterium flavum TaxID=1424659 RepID=A0A4R8V196_9MICO|nr:MULTISPECIES: GNAT family protein [Cryobacterium]TFB75043.1 N-acetyltransferase [Cryobacterium flavum]SDO60522.1 Protein N-acetyltransferase, RimJ/RimL family [Cryobacterium flavum]